MEPVWYEGAEALAKLREHGLGSGRGLHEAMQKARAEARMCTWADAPGAAAYTFWSRVNRFLYEELGPSGWKLNQRDMILRCVRPDGQFCLTGISGLGDVGVKGGSVQTKNPKGSAMEGVVRFNARHVGYRPPPSIQPPLPVEGLPVESPFAEVFELGSVPTWILLYKWTDTVLMSELSYPVDMVGNTVNCWLEHILLEPIDFGPDAPGFTDFTHPDGPDDFGPDVLVERLTS